MSRLQSHTWSTLQTINEWKILCIYSVYMLLLVNGKNNSYLHQHIHFLYISNLYLLAHFHCSKYKQNNEFDSLLQSDRDLLVLTGSWCFDRLSILWGVFTISQQCLFNIAFMLNKTTRQENTVWSRHLWEGRHLLILWAHLNVFKDISNDCLQHSFLCFLAGDSLLIYFNLQAVPWIGVPKTAMHTSNLLRLYFTFVWEVQGQKSLLMANIFVYTLLIKNLRISFFLKQITNIPWNFYY